ncbi:MAG TPA: phage tail protein [Blastocatellia bacterium]|nr:phage tail protein [Blastocatellia bacterium]
MRLEPQGATFWLIGGQGGWEKRTAETSQTAVNDSDGVRLGAARGGPLSLDAPDCSLGGLILPRGFALDGQNTLYLLSREDLCIKRYDPETRTFQRLPEIGGAGSEPRQFKKPRNIAIAGKWLYVADSENRRVQVFDLENLALTEIWGPTGARAEWQPVDVAEHKRSVYILDRHKARIYRHTPGSLLREHSSCPGREDQWTRIAVDREGRIYLLKEIKDQEPVLEMSDCKGPGFKDAGTLRDRFDPPAIRLDEAGRFCLPPSLARLCARQMPRAAPAPEAQLGLCAPFDRELRRCEEPAAPRTVRTAAGAFLVYVLEREQRRVRAYTIDGLRLRHAWGHALDWKPVDVAARGMMACVLDEDGTVYRHRAGREEIRAVVPTRERPPIPTRIAIDNKGAILLHAPGEPTVLVYDCRESRRGERRYSEVADLFEAAEPKEAPSLSTGLIFDKQGEPVESLDPKDQSGLALYQTSGTWQGKPLDSSIYRCQWHRIELNASGLPPGSRIEVRTYAHEEEEDVIGVPDQQWQHAYTILAPIEPPQCDQKDVRRFEFLVQSGSGRYLSIMMKLDADSFSTPVVQSIKAHYPRESYLKYLPAAWSADDESRMFLERFLAIFQTEWDDIELRIDEIAQYFDPEAVPDGPFLEYLARQWLALPLEGDWNQGQKRKLLAAVPKIYPHRGKLRGLRDFIAVYLANMANLPADEVRGTDFPVIVEGFRERQHLILAEGASRLGQSGPPLWSASVTRRLQLGVFSREGEAELVSTGDPSRDIFHHYAHRFRVLVPASWVRTADDERKIRRAIEAEKPAQTRYDLCLLDARFRVGVQSTVGVDTIMGETPLTTLGCEHVTDRPPSLPRSGRLGLDTILTSARGDMVMRLAPGATVGKGSLLA